MDNPFPGINPYLEDPAWWSDFHLTFLVCLREAIAAKLPDAYDVRIDERIRLAGPTRGEAKLIEPDLTVTRRGDEAGLPAAGGAAVALEIEPVRLALPMKRPRRQRFLKVVHLPDRNLVTIVELLSPSNKSGDDRIAYLANRSAIFWQEVNLVELDLLTRGQRLPMEGQLPAGDYFAFVSRAGRRPECDVYRWSVRQRLPAILPIPLLGADADAVVSLDEAYRTAFGRGAYGRALRYDTPPPGRWSHEDRAWIIEQAGAASRQRTERQ